MLPPLATLTDLDNRGVDPPSFNSNNMVAVPDYEALLDSASAAVRDAAGCAISFTTSTIVLVVDESESFQLPAGPVAAVGSVVVNGLPVIGWRKVGDTVLMPRRWTTVLPVEVTVTYDHGYPVIPADIVDLVCALASMALTDGADSGYGSGSRRQSTRLGEFAESYTHPAGTESPSPVALPDAVRARLRGRFGSPAAVLKVLR